jgi:hypothetical protein
MALTLAEAKRVVDGAIAEARKRNAEIALHHRPIEGVRSRVHSPRILR